MATRPSGQGFMLLDLLAVTAIAGLMMALFLPEVDRAREAARRNQCMNKMKQIALALQNHHDVAKRFPATSTQGQATGIASVWWPLPGSGAATGAIPSVGYTTDAGTKSATAGYSWIVKILPYMDGAALFNTIARASGKFTADAFTPYNVAGVGTGQDFSVVVGDDANKVTKHFAAVELGELICPSYSGSATVAPSAYSGKPAAIPPAAYGGPVGSKLLGSPPGHAAISNYVALSATHFPCMQYATVEKLAATTTIPEGADAPNGMIVPGVGLNMKTCTDGTSKTLMVCETIEPAMNCWYDGTAAWTTAINPNSIATDPPNKADRLTSSGQDNPNHFWNVAAGGTTALNVGPDPNTATAYSPALAGYCETPQIISWGPSSNHMGGVVIHVAVDASAHAITQDVDPTLYMHIITRAGREPDAFPDVAN